MSFLGPNFRYRHCVIHRSEDLALLSRDRYFDMGYLTDAIHNLSDLAVTTFFIGVDNNGGEI